MLPAILATVLVIHAFLWFVHWELVYRRHMRLTPRLASLPSADAPATPVTVFVPARNEEAGIGRAVRSLCDSAYPNLHIVCINDHSTDRTGEILQQLAGEYTPGRLTVLNAPELPPGWMGKCHALHHGVSNAPMRGDVYLFTDADVIHEPHAIARAVHHMQRDRLDLLAVFPRVWCEGLAENVVLPILSHLGLLHLNPANVSDPTRREFAGVGAFCMIRRTMYDSWGGHESIKGEVIDDMAMGLRTKRAGGRLGLAGDPSAVRLRMYSDLDSIIRGFEKNMHQAIGRGFLLSVAAALSFPLTHCVPLIVALLSIVTGTGWPWLPAWAFVLHLLTGWRLALRSAQVMDISRWKCALLYPAGAAIAMYIMLRSAWHAEFHGEVHWRGRRLPRPEQETRLGL